VIDTLLVTNARIFAFDND